VSKVRGATAQTLYTVRC